MTVNNLVDLIYDFQPEQYFKLIGNQNQTLTRDESDYLSPVFSKYLEKTITDNNFYEQLSLFKEVIVPIEDKGRVINSLLDTTTVHNQSKQVNYFLQELILSHIQTYPISDTTLNKIKLIKQTLCKEIFIYLSYYTHEFKDQLLNNTRMDTDSEPNTLIIYGVGLFDILQESSYLHQTLENLTDLLSDAYVLLVDLEGMLTTKYDYTIFKHNLKRLYQINPNTRICVDDIEYGEGDEDEFPIVFMFLILALMKILLLLKLLYLGEDTFEIASKKELSSYLFVAKLFMFMSKPRKPLFKR